MIADLKPYSAMKNSGAEWLGEVPEHWEVRQLGRIGRFSKGNGGTKEDEVESGVPCVRYGDLYTQHRFFIQKARSFVSQETFKSYTPIHYGDVLFAGSGETIEEIGKSAVSLLPEPACCGGDVIIFRPSVTFDARFFGLATDCPQAAYQKSCMGRGITVMHIYGDELKYMVVALPPLPEQAAIVRYLDHVDGRVRRLVRAKRKLISLLTEQKQAIIHRAVTRGLDPDVPLRDSGIEWLGEVPEHWEVRRVKAVCSAIIDCKNRTPDAIDGGEYTVVRTTCIRDGKFDPTGGYKTDEKNYRIWTARGAPRSGDVFFTREAPAGEACMVPDRNDLCMGQRMMYLRPEPSVLDAAFLLLNVYGPLTKTYVELETHGSTVGHLRLGQVYSLPIMWCPLDEQREIASAVGQAAREIEQAIAAAQWEISLIGEYQTRLIADVVTGKLDVRGAAAALPEADPLDTEDDLDDALDTDAEAQLADLDAIPEEAGA